MSSYLVIIDSRTQIRVTLIGSYGGRKLAEMLERKGGGEKVSVIDGESWASNGDQGLFHLVYHPS